MIMDRETRLALADPNAEMLELLKKAPVSKGLAEFSDIPSLRGHLANLKKAATSANTTSTTSTTYVETDRRIPMRDGSNIAIRVHSPKIPPEGGSPGLIFFHGGGFCLGGLDNEVSLCRKWTDLGGVAVNVDYRLAPEYLFPTAVHDAYDAVKWTSDHVEELGISPEKGYLIGGVSAGGNLAAVITHLYRDDQLSPPLTGQYLSIPAICEPSALPAKYKDMYLSREQNQDALVLNQDAIDLFEGTYKPDPNSPLRSPLVFSSQKGVPPAYFQISGADPLRDEGLIYETVLREDYGIKTKLDIFPGLPHGFPSWFPMANFSKDYQEKCNEGLKWLLKQPDQEL